MSSVVNKSKNKFAPKAKVRARNVASATPTATDSNQSVAPTPAPVAGSKSHVEVVINLPAKSTTALATDPLPTPISQYSSYEQERESLYHDRNAGIPVLAGASEKVPPLIGDAIPTSAGATPGIILLPSAESVGEVDTERGTEVIGVPQLEDDAILESPMVSVVAEKMENDKAKTKRNGKVKEVPEELGQASANDTEAAAEASGAGTIALGTTATATAKKTRTRTARAPRAPKRKATTVTAAELEAGPSTGQIRRSSREKRQRTADANSEGIAKEGGDEEPPEDEEAIEEDEEDEDEYQEEQQSKKTKPKPTKTGAPRKPKTPTKSKEPSERKTRRRAESPVDAEHRTIQESVVKMKDLCQDPRIGKKSRRGKELDETDWNEVVRRQRAYKAELAARRARGEIVDETTEQRLERLAEASTSARAVVAAPQMRVVDGQIVIDEESLRIDRHKRDALEEETMEVVEENVHTRLVNSGTWAKRDKGDRWEAEDTDRFYEALSMFGTDFEIISRLFPGRSRRQIKNKFNCEERKEPLRVTQALKTRVQADMNEYSTIAGQQFPDPIELEEELQQLRNEHEAEADFQKEQAVEMERERQELANQAMRDAENGIVHEQPGKRKKKSKSKDQKTGEVVLSMSIEEYERERLRQLEDEG
ncbi:hypothetical protein BDD12DRAFT_807177 [Trichophaea hybrida]|nr:hypothetical protein BDD12DRAFT_807177 [Trichophaea hybrida]